MKEFIVTARKWRPQKFEDVVGQEHITQTLKNSIKSGKIAHAFIFSGPRGIGKTSTARILAKSLNCPNQVEYNPCNNCEVCESITNGNNIDVIEIDGASNRRIEEIRTIRESVKYAPSTVKYKIYIIDEVHMLTTESFNALLKVLEEPPPHVIFIFATTDIHKVPATILSRCQRYEFRRLTTEEIKNHLIKIAKFENIEYDEDTLRFIARRADGAMRDAQSIFDQLVVYSNGKVVLSEVKDILNIIDVDVFFRVTEAIKTRKIKDAFDIVNEIYFNGWDLSTFTNDMIEHFRNMLTVSITNDTSLIDASEQVKERYKSTANYFSTKDLLRLLSFLGKSQYELKQSPNQKLKLEIILAQLIELPRSADIEELIEELKKLKNNQNIPIASGQVKDAKVVEVYPKPSQQNKSQIKDDPENLKLDLSTNKIIESPITLNKTELNSTGLPTSTQNILNRWNEFLNQLTAENSILGKSLSNFKPSKIENDKIYLYPINPAEDLDLINIFESLLIRKTREFFGKPYKFSSTNSPPLSAQSNINADLQTSSKQTSKDNISNFTSISESDKNLNKNLSAQDLYARKLIIEKLRGRKLDN